MAARAFGKTAIRSTMLTFFVPAYALALVLQVSVARVAVDTWATTATLAPATLVGLLSGNALASRIGERVFRLWIAFLLSSTAVVLSIDAFSRASS
jgi:uncharacterized membrane protein YfcA